MRNLLPCRQDFLAPLEVHFNKFFDNFFKDTNPLASIKATDFPKVNAYEEEDHFKIVVSVPGVKSENLKVNYDTETNCVTISGRIDEAYRLGSPDLRDSSKKAPTRTYLQELRTSHFGRTLQLPENVDGEPEANLKDGILSLTWKLTKQKVIQNTIKVIPIKCE